MQTPASYASFQSSTILSKTGRTRREHPFPINERPRPRRTKASTTKTDCIQQLQPCSVNTYLATNTRKTGQTYIISRKKERKRIPHKKKSINQRPQWQSLPHPHPHPPPFLPPPRPPHEKNPPPTPPPQTQNNTPPSTHHKKKNQNPTRKKKKRNNESPASRSTPTTAASATTSSSPRRGTSTVSRGDARPRPTGP